ncbi:MAG TPA: DUF1835 domain-containing protein [Candidatus Acidoferrales bacterium]|nr:DUF1835 domain-containing protein [Candidatus Acidoferrales bacterium]
MSARSAAALHVTNGDSVLYLFRKAGIAGTHLAWRDSLNEGPVADLPLEALSALRAGYLAERGFGPPIKIFHDFEVRDALLRRASTFAEVVLWFEHDLYDQLQILQVLTTLEALDLEPGAVSLVQSDHYLGLMTVEELSALLPRRRAVTAATYKSAARAWARVTSQDPQALHEAAREDAIGLPFLRAAMLRFCEEYPWRSDGLSRSQRQALQAVAAGLGTDGELFRRAQAREEASFLGDAAFVRVLDDLAASQAPLIEGEPGNRTPTALGRRVLAGGGDWLEAAPIDRWIGGVHLHPDFVVRWDDAASRFVR